jgi:hypothetical protein
MCNKAKKSKELILSNYLRLMHKKNLDLSNLSAFMTYMHLKDKSLQRLILKRANKNISKITMNLISLALNELYPVIRSAS